MSTASFGDYKVSSSSGKQIQQIVHSHIARLRYKV